MEIFVPENMREGYEVFHTFIDNNIEKVKANEEMYLELTNLDTLGKVVARALIKEKCEETEAWDDLWIRDKDDRVVPEPMKVKIVEELDPEETDVKRPGFEEESGSTLYGSVLTTKKMEQDAVMFKKQFGRKKLEKK